MTQLYGIPQTPGSHIRLTAKSRGTLGELTAAMKLKSHGFDTHKLREGDKLGDLFVPAFNRTIEVKTAFRGSRGTFQFCMKRENKPGISRGATDCHYADFVMLICVEDDYSTIAIMIPSDMVNVKKIEFADPLMCKWRNYLCWQ